MIAVQCPFRFQPDLHAYVKYALASNKYTFRSIKCMHTSIKCTHVPNKCAHVSGKCAHIYKKMCVEVLLNARVFYGK